MNENIEPVEPSENELDLKAIVRKYLVHWYWFLIAIVICLFIAFMYLRYATPEYSVTASVLIKDDKSNGATDSPLGDLDIFKSGQNVNNEIQLLKSKSLMERVVRELNLQNKFYFEGDIKKSEIYGVEMPIVFTTQKQDSASFGKIAHLTLHENKTFTWEDEKGEKTYAYGKPFTTSYGTFSIQPNATNLNSVEGMKLVIYFNSVAEVAQDLNTRLQVTTVDKDATVLNLQINLPNRQKGIIF